ncbi:hypothetical protein AVEN_235088-1 [Araneus ventricosus]|uniref:Uncharacterized protein n=1 Tax=Araneus ventricosus TaxID=182803 RepID=A0A4Y2NMG3_ARAVE|nr:hypothetical protein AVEN_235088-1 [Araneus ventricosus]
MEYSLKLNEDKDYVYLPPTQEPIDPPYKEAVMLKRQNKLAKPEFQVSHVTLPDQCSGSTEKPNSGICDTGENNSEKEELPAVEKLQLSDRQDS